MNCRSQAFNLSRWIHPGTAPPPATSSRLKALDWFASTPATVELCPGHVAPGMGRLPRLYHVGARDRSPMRRGWSGSFVVPKVCSGRFLGGVGIFLSASSAQRLHPLQSVTLEECGRTADGGRMKACRLCTSSRVSLDLSDVCS
jgi:hypothetical protein